MLFRLDDVGPRQTDPVRPARVGRKHIEPRLGERLEPGRIIWRAVHEGVAVGQVNRGDPRAVDPLPEKLGREILPRHAAHEPECLEPSLREQLRHLGVVAERVDQPAGGDVDSELVAIIALAILHLADEGLAARHVVIGHDVERTDQLEPPFGQETAEIGLVGRIALQERPHVSDLVERESVSPAVLSRAASP